MGNYLEINNLIVNYKTIDDKKNVLNISRIAVEKGKSYGIVGESGSGKTVLALTIQGLLATPPGEIESGEILLDSQDVLKMSAKEIKKLRGNKVSMIFQDPMSTLNPVFTVGFQMERILIDNKHYNKTLAKEKTIEMARLVKLPDPEDTLNKYPHELSGGQRQRIIIGMALLCGAELIIADEPTRNLDVTIQAGILKLIYELQNDLGVTVLFIANNLSLVSAVCDEIAILRNGIIVEQGTTANVINNPQNEYTKMLLKSVTPQMKGKSNCQNTLARDNTILTVDHLKKYYPVQNQFTRRKNLFVKAVDDVSFSLSKGTTLGIVGESGCGKSTLVNTLLYLINPTEGEVIFDNKAMFSLEKKKLREERKNVQIVFQDPFWSLNPRMLVKDIIGEPLKVHKKMGRDEYIKEVMSLAELVGLPGTSIFKYPHEFSGGQRQRIAIARSLSVNPKMIVLDEPTSAIDIVSQSSILELLDSLKNQMQLTYIIISHDLSVVHYMADEIIVMYLGKIVESGPSDIIFNDPKHPYTQALFNSIPSMSINNVDDLVSIKGEVPSAINPPIGCRFNPRCEHCMEICKTNQPSMQTISNREVACFLFES